jgi:hypothetical protein
LDYVVPYRLPKVDDTLVVLFQPQVVHGNPAQLQQHLAHLVTDTRHCNAEKDGFTYVLDLEDSILYFVFLKLP